MAEITYGESVLVEAEPERVFDYRLDFQNLSDYNPSVSNVRVIEDESGPEYRFDLTLPGATESLEVPLRITGAKRPHRFTYETGPGWMARGECTFEPKDNGTLVTLTYTLTFPEEIDEQTAAMLESSGREQSRVELDNIKKVLEG